MAKMSVLVPSRNEHYLIPTVDECFNKAGGDVEVVVVLEGYVPDGWNDVIAKYPNLHTVYHNQAKGLRQSINAAAASAISRGAKYLFKLDAHCMLDEGYDVKLQADIEPNWIVVPRRKRLDVENWKVREDSRPDIDYHYLSFPDNPQDFGGPGLNGKVWEQRARERFGKPEYEIDDEMSSQGSGWCTSVGYFQELELMDHANYGPFWNEMQECGLKAWLSGGRLVVNKKTWYAHWHKGSAGRGYNLPKDWLNTGATFTRRWLFNDAWARQTRPFAWIIEHFWPVPTWPENWQELVYGTKVTSVPVSVDKPSVPVSQLTVHYATYGLDDPAQQIDVTEKLQSLVTNGSLDLNVTNDALGVGNPFRGLKKRLRLTYSYNGDERVDVIKDERDWLIIGGSARYVKVGQQVAQAAESINKFAEAVSNMTPEARAHIANPKSLPLDATALTDKLIRKFAVSSHRLRGPMPIEVPSFHRNDLAQLLAELQFNHGAEIGVAEANYSEVLCKANPNLHLLCVDPWHHYSGNVQHHSREHHEFSYNETVRKLAPYPNVKLVAKYSMDAVRDVVDESLDFVYLDGNHSYDYIMSDLIEWSKKVRSGGLIACDDYYYLSAKWGAGPVEAVNDYTRAHGITPWFAFAGHKSVDTLWVKP